MKKGLHTLFFFFISLYITGCTTEPDIKEKEIDSKINIAMKEDLSPSGRSLIFYCTTEFIYPCANYDINYDKEIIGNNISICFTGISQPNICLTAFGPAQAIIDLGSFTPGNYNLELYVNYNLFKTTLTVSQESYLTADSVSNIISITNPILFRIPANGIWGNIQYSDSAFEIQANKFLDTLKAIGAKQTLLNQGSYGYFDVDSTGTIIPLKNSSLKFSKPFFYTYNDDITNIRDIVKYYAKNSALSIELYSSKGDAFYTWQLANEP